MKRVQPYLDDPVFSYDKMKSKSAAAANLCNWVVNIITYNKVYKKIRPLMEDLAAAQHRKYQAILDRLDLRPEHHLLEIGSGWGGFAIHAAQTTGCRITSITLSDEQLAEARHRAEAAGVADRVEFRLQDYRDLREQFDRVVSIEMYEAVGEAFWPTYFRTIRNVLRQDGVAVLQGITIDHAHFDDYRQRMDFIQKYIFPGGMLASPEAFTQAAADVGLQADRPDFFGPHYAETLRRWHDKVLEHRDAIVSQFDEFTVLATGSDEHQTAKSLDEHIKELFDGNATINETGGLGECVADVPCCHGINESDDLLSGWQSEHVLQNLGSQRRLACGDESIHKTQCIAHRTIAQASNLPDGISLRFDFFLLKHIGQMLSNPSGRQIAEVETLTTALDRC